VSGVVTEVIQANTMIQTDSTISIRNAGLQRHDAWQLYVRVAVKRVKDDNVSATPALDCRGWFSECEFGADNGGVVLGRDLSFTLLTNTFRRPPPPLPPFPSL